MAEKIKKIFEKILKRKKFVLAAIFVWIIFSFFFFNPVMAADEPAKPTALQTAIVMVVSWITASVAYVLGFIITLIIDVLATVAIYNNIIGVAAVEQGWVIVRDLCNMFFILILLVIAFATILRIESYNAKKLLPKLLIMAVLINFSRTICGLIIDFGQVIMLTFVNGFSANNATANFVQLFQVDSYLSFSEAAQRIKSEGVETGNLAWNVLLGLAAGVIAMIITLIVLIVLLAVLVMRIVMLWVYTILSPLAFLLSAFPAGHKFSQQWWSEFSKNVIVGPVLAFFIWLALLTAQQSAESLKINIEKTKAKGTEAKEITAGNKLFQTGNFQTYIITIALLIGGLMVTQQIGGIAGSIAGKGMAAIQKGKGLAMGMAMKGARTAITNTAKATSRTALRAGGAMIGAGAKEGSTRGKIGAFVNQWGGDLKTTREKAKAEKRRKTLEKLGMRDDVGGGMERLDTMLKDKKIQKATNVAKGAVAIGAGVATGGWAGLAMAAAGIAKGVSKKGPIADTLEQRGKGGEIREAEKEKEKINQEVGKERADKLKPVEDIKNVRLQNIEAMRQGEINKLEPKPRHTDSESVKKKYNDKVEMINEKAENGKKDVNEDFEKEKGEINTHRQGELDSANSRVEAARSRQGKVGKFFEDRGREMKGPNHFTIEAVKIATEQNQQIRNKVRDLGEDDVHEFDKHDFHSPGGPNTKHQKLFDSLNSSTGEAAKAVKKMTESVRDMPRSISDAQRLTILSLKQMMAAQNAAGKDMGKFSNLIGELDKRTDIQDKKGNATIDAIAKTFSAKTTS